MMRDLHAASTATRVIAALSFAALIACGDDQASTAPAFAPTLDQDPARVVMSADAVPSPLVTASLRDRSVEFWPYTGTDFSGTPQDPINLIFFGEADPRAIRAALMSLSGDRSAFGFPSAFPFNCVWSDAIGNVQTAYASTDRWAGSAVQLECGSYGPLRFHLRLFRQGSATLGNVHFEVLIPNTTVHEVLSWKLAQNLVTADMARSGLLGAAPSPTAPIHPTSFHTIRPAVYNGLPVSLRAAIGGPLGNVSEPVPVASTGVATMFELARALPVVAGEDAEEIPVTWNQVIPKPFCAAGPTDYVLVQGPITLRQRAGIGAAGEYYSEFSAEATLQLTPVNPLTVPATPVGDPYTAEVQELHSGVLTDYMSKAQQFQLQMELPSDGPNRGSLRSKLHVGPTQSAGRYSLDIDC